MNKLEYKLSEYEKRAYPEWKRVGGITPIDNAVSTHKGETAIKGLSKWKNRGAKIYRITNTDKDLDDIYYVPYAEELAAFDEYKYGTDLKYVLQGESLFGTGYIIQIPDNLVIEEPLIIDYLVSEDNPSMIDHTFILVGENSKANIVIRYAQSDMQMAGYHNGLTKVYAKKNSNLLLTKLQMFKDQVVHIDNTVSILENDSKVTYSSFDFGGSKIVTDYSSYLVGDRSMSKTVTAYLGDGERKLDIGYNVTHIGKRSESLIECKGALLDNAKKIFRGNLKFVRGAKKSIGKESEFVLLLDKGVHSDAIPALLCDEDDVIGEHAASAGQVDEQQLFYLMSRGFSVNEAKKMVIHGSFSVVIDLLPNQALKDQVEDELGRRLLDA